MTGIIKYALMSLPLRERGLKYVDTADTAACYSTPPRCLKGVAIASDSPCRCQSAQYLASSSPSGPLPAFCAAHAPFSRTVVVLPPGNGTPQPTRVGPPCGRQKLAWAEKLRCHNILWSHPETFATRGVSKYSTNGRQERRRLLRRNSAAIRTARICAQKSAPFTGEARSRSGLTQRILRKRRPSRP